MWSTDLTEEETEALIQKAAHEIARRKLQTPAILFLEMHKPLANVGASAALVAAPFVVPLLGYQFVNDYSRLFSRSANIERLLVRLEQLSNPPATKDE